MDLYLIESFYKMLVILIYSGSIVITMIFIFSIKMYLRIDEALNMNFFITKIISPAGIYTNVLNLDNWFIAHNRLIGVFLFALSTYDLIMLYNIQIAGLF